MRHVAFLTALVAALTLASAAGASTVQWRVQRALDVAQTVYPATKALCPDGIDVRWADLTAGRNWPDMPREAEVHLDRALGGFVRPSHDPCLVWMSQEYMAPEWWGQELCPALVHEVGHLDDFADDGQLNRFAASNPADPMHSADEDSNMFHSAAYTPACRDWGRPALRIGYRQTCQWRWCVTRSEARG